MRPTAVLEEFTDEFVLAEAERLLIPYGLKSVFRYWTGRDLSVHIESVAEHKFALQWLARYFLPLEDRHRGLNWAQVYDILLVHDFGKIGLHQDIPYHRKTAVDEAAETTRAEVIFSQLPASIAVEYRAHWRYYQTQATPEARFAYALDKLEPVFELFDGGPKAVSMNNCRFTYQDHIGKKRRVIEGRYPFMWRFVEVMSEDMRRRGVFWERPEEDGA